MRRKRKVTIYCKWMQQYAFPFILLKFPNAFSGGAISYQMLSRSCLGNVRRNGIKVDAAFFLIYLIILSRLMHTLASKVKSLM